MTRPWPLLLAVPVLMAPGTCAFGLDYTETFLINDPIERVEITVDRGNIDALAWDRQGIVLKRHTFGFQRDLGEAVKEIEDDVLHLELLCVQDGPCSSDHLFELPYGIGFDITLEDGYCSLGYVDGDIAANVGAGLFRGVRLAAPNVSLTAGQVEVDLDFAAPPENVSIDLEEGDVLLAVPSGAYRCEFTADGAVESGVECDDAAAAALSIRVGRGAITVTEAAP